jgi:hypothetical protein
MEVQNLPECSCTAKTVSLVSDSATQSQMLEAQAIGMIGGSIGLPSASRGVWSMAYR